MGGGKKASDDSLGHNFLYLLDASVLSFGNINDYENGSGKA